MKFEPAGSRGNRKHLWKDGGEAEDCYLELRVLWGGQTWRGNSFCCKDTLAKLQSLAQGVADQLAAF